jgi:hypothetical protein
MTTEALLQARNIVRHLTIQEKLHLLNDITAQLVQASTITHVPARPAFPVFHLDEWPVDVPTRRKDLYNDRGR